jgi:hypothetical protein
MARTITCGENRRIGHQAKDGVDGGEDQAAFFNGSSRGVLPLSNGLPPAPLCWFMPPACGYALWCIYRKHALLAYLVAAATGLTAAGSLTFRHNCL